MSDPIRTQIDSLSAQLATQHTELMGVLSTLASSIVAPIDYTASFADLSLLLTDIRSSLGTRRSPTDPFTWTIDIINSNLAIALSNQIDLQAAVDAMAANVALLQQTMGLHTGGAEFTIASLTRAQLTALNSIYTRLAGIDAPWPADVLAALECICSAASAALPIDPTDPATVGYCSEPWVSTGQVVLPWSLIGGTSQMFAVFDVLPDGLSYGSTFGLSDDHSELDAVDWTGWRVFVQSDQPQYADGADLLGVARFPTNQWNALTGTNPRAFSIDARGSIKVYLCSPDGTGAPAIPEGECHNFGPTGTDGSNYVVSIPEYPADYTLQTSQPAYVTDGDNITHFVNYGIAWTQEDVGPGPWIVRLGYTGDPPETAFVVVCNPPPA